MDLGSQDQEMPDYNSSFQNESEAPLFSSVQSPIASTSTPQSLANPTPQVSNNDPKFKYKYPEARPTPPGEDDTAWNKVYTAADSRMYNKHGKDASNSRKFRVSGETRTLAIKMLQEKKEKEAAGVPPRAIAKPRVTSAVRRAPKKETSGSRDATPDYSLMSMSISEKIKAEGRGRKPSLSITVSNHGTPAPSSGRMGSPAPPAAKIDRPAPIKKKGTAAPVRKPGPKKVKNEEKSAMSLSRRASDTPGPTAAALSSGTESNDGGEYCICHGPDDHRMMVNCEGGCDDWYHCECLKMDEDDCSKLLDRFICPNCRTAEKFTTWKRMCRYNNVSGKCRNAARVTDDPPSKYCSDTCKHAFFMYIKSLLRSDGKPSMGGALSQAEFGTLIKDSNGSVEAFHRLGQKPRLPVKEGADPTHPVGLNYLTPIEKDELEKIKAETRVINAQIEGIECQSKLLNLIHERAKIGAQQPNLEVKDICGYDPRLAFNEVQFLQWFSSDEGRATFDTGVLGPRSPATKHINARIPVPGLPVPEEADVPDPLKNICLNGRKRCKHIGWREVHNQEYQETKTSLSKELRRLEKAGELIVDDAETREATKGYYADNITIQLF